LEELGWASIRLALVRKRRWPLLYEEKARLGWLSFQIPWTAAAGRRIHVCFAGTTVIPSIGALPNHPFSRGALLGSTAGPSDS